jgi:hypothetical protein
MDLQIWKRSCPTLFELFGTCEQILNPKHPLRYLVSIDNEKVSQAAIKTESSARSVKGADSKWLNSKSEIIKSGSPEAASATLSEIRAYGDLLHIWNPENVQPRSSGSDFVVSLGNERVWVEVNTPHGRSDPKKVSRLLESTTKDKVSIGITEFAPFGLPEDHDSNVQAECVSKIASIKDKKDGQFHETEISILWLDFNDPRIWTIQFDSDQALPVISWRESLTSGCLWNAFYAEQGDPIFDDISVVGIYSNYYEMGFPGRFNQETNIDFVVIDTLRDKVVFQNHKGEKPVPDQLFRRFFTLPGFSLKHSWLDWPVRGSLENRVNHTRKEIELFKSVFKIF